MTSNHASAAASRSSANHDRLIEAAVQSFARKGYHATTTRDISTAAGMSPAALYVHFPSKEELLYVIARDGHEDIRRVVRDALASPGGPSERLFAMVRTVAIHHVERRTVARVVNFQLGGLNPAHWIEVGGLRQDVLHEVEDLIVEGVRLGEFQTDDPELAALLVLSLAVDVARWHDSSSPRTSGQVADRIAATALDIVGARPRDLRLAS